MKPKLAFVDHSFHKKSRAGDFLRDILASKFTVVDLWDDSWQGPGHDTVTVTDINQGNFDYVFFFQSLLPIHALKQIRAPLIWAPMYDAAIWYPVSFWVQLTQLPLKIISFSSALSTIMNRFPLDICNVQFYMNPENFSPVTYTHRTAFFWQRTNLTFQHVKQLIRPQSIDRLILKLDPDPQYQAVYPTAEEMKRYHIILIQGTIAKEEYMRLLHEANIFIAPRKYEGIGMSFIETMTMGMAVVALNYPTMNEYITSQKTGYLFSDKKIHELDLSNFTSVGIAARSSCEQGYQQWLDDQQCLLAYIVSPYIQPKPLTSYQQVMYRMAQYVDIIKKGVQYRLAKRFL